MRPMIMEYPLDENTFDMEDQFMLGENILIKPIVKPDQQFIDIYLPSNSIWFDYYTNQAYNPGKHSIPVHPDHIAVFIKSGSIIPL